MFIQAPFCYRIMYYVLLFSVNFVQTRLFFKTVYYVLERLFVNNYFCWWHRQVGNKKRLRYTESPDKYPKEIKSRYHSNSS